MTITATSGEISLAARSTCSPSTLGMRRSVMTASVASRRRASMAASPPAAVGHGLHGVDAEIPDGLAELLGIHAGGEALAVLADDLEGDGHGAVLDEEHDLFEEIGEVDLVPGHGRGPSILEKIPDDPVQTL